MFEKIVTLAFLTVFLVASSACVSRVQGATNVIAIEATDLSGIDNMKRGEACRTTILLFTFGNQLITEAANSAGIKEIKFVEHEYRFYLIAGQSCVVVYGE